MNIGYLTAEYPGLTPSGGIGTSVRNLGRALIGMGHRVTVYLVADCAGGRTVHDGLIIRTIRPCTGVPLSGILTRLKAASIINSDYFAGRLDLLESADWGGMTALMPLLCPVIIRCNGSDAYFCELDNRPVRLRNLFLEMITLRSARAVISVSEYTARRTETLFNLYDRDIGIVRNCVPQEFLDRSRPSESVVRKPIVLYIGTLIRKKGIYEIPAIFNRVHEVRPDARLVIAGKDTPDDLSGSTWISIQRMFTSSAARQVEYLGTIPYEHVIELLLEASVSIFPSYAEAFPLSWMEAMSARCPVVASNIGWAQEMITDGITGYLVDPRNHEHYARRIIHLMNHADEANAIGRMAHEHVVANYSGGVVAHESINQYRLLL